MYVISVLYKSCEVKRKKEVDKVWEEMQREKRQGCSRRGQSYSLP